MTHEPFAALFKKGYFIPNPDYETATHEMGPDGFPRPRQHTTMNEESLAASAIGHVFKYQPDASSPSFNETPQQQFVRSFRYLAAEIHQNAVTKGFWDGGRNDGEAIALMHSELSEALESIRHGNGPSDHIPEFSGAEEEFADCIIRIIDLSHAHGWRIGEALLEKMAFNESRPHKHGKKF